MSQEPISVELQEVPPEALKLAAALSLLADRALSQFDRLAAIAVSDIATAANDDRPELAATVAQVFITELDRLASEIVVENQQQAAALLVPNARKSESPSAFPAQFSAQQLLVAKARSRIQEGQLTAEAAQANTGLTPGAAAGLYLLPLRVVNELRRAFDYLSASVIHRSVHEAGTGIFRLKVAVPVLDRETTALCRNRMAFQVREWDAMYVDPESGAEWLYPPFIGAGLPAAESFHYCRTASVPFK